MVRPRAAAALRLMTSSNLVGWKMGDIGGPDALQDLVDHTGHATLEVRSAHPIGHKPPGIGELPKRIDRGQPMHLC
jgi:hypothetical protein